MESIPLPNFLVSFDLLAITNGRFIEPIIKSQAQRRHQSCALAMVARRLTASGFAGFDNSPPSNSSLIKGMACPHPALLISLAPLVSNPSYHTKHSRPTLHPINILTTFDRPPFVPSSKASKGGEKGNSNNARLFLHPAAAGGEE